MAVIDIGSGATNRASNTQSWSSTYLDLGNTADGTGVLSSFEIWFNTDGASVKIGTFYTSTTQYASRDYESIGNVASGSKQTFTGKNCDVSSGDYLGITWSTGNIEYDLSGGSGSKYYLGDAFGSTKTFSPNGASDSFSIYATGATGGGGPTPAIKVGGAWKETTSQKIKVGGSWRTVSSIKIKQGGAWKSVT